jgi:hypothetical protein
MFILDWHLNNKLGENMETKQKSLINFGGSDYHKDHHKFVDRMIKRHYITGIDLLSTSAEEVDTNEKYQISKENMEALGIKDGVQLMLGAQMLTVHEWQQKLLNFAVSTNNQDQKLHLLNSAIKLSNLFVQQINLMSKLQGQANQPVVVDQVHVHSGGQAVVGSVVTYQPEGSKK